MRTTSFNGATFSPHLFIHAFDEAAKVAPARFLTLRVHPARYKELEDYASLPKAIQMGVDFGPLGSSVMRVLCVNYRTDVVGGVKIMADSTVHPSTLIFDLYGNPELVIEDIGELTPKSDTSIG